MGSEYLAVVGQEARFVGISAILVIILYGAIVSLIIIALVRLVRFLGTANKEMQRTRMEVGKLAEEVHVLGEKLGVDRQRDT